MYITIYAMPALSIARANSIVIRNRLMNTYFKTQLLKQLRVKNKCIKVRKYFVRKN